MTHAYKLLWKTLQPTLVDLDLALILRIEKKKRIAGLINVITAYIFVHVVLKEIGKNTDVISAIDLHGQVDVTLKM